MKRILAIFLSILTIFSLFGCSGNELKKRVIDAGFENVTISTGGSHSVGSYAKVTNYSINCSNFDSLSYEEMISKAKQVEYVAAGSGYYYNLTQIVCNGNTYTIDFDNRVIKKNGSTVYTDYEHSPAYKRSQQPKSSDSNKGSYSGGYSYGESSKNAKKCQYCKRSFTDATNKNYIEHTNMCRNCYRNYCWAIGETPSNYDR